MATYDILIKSGLVIDGTLTPASWVDVGIKGERIADVGNLSGADAKILINAEGKYVTPGFIDITNHSDTRLAIFKYPGLESYLKQGVTTVIGGNCGSSLAPLVNKEALSSLGKWSDLTEINIDWNGVGEFLEKIENLGLGINFGTFVGYGILKRGVIRNESRLLKLEEREQIKFLAERGIKEGAFGLSLGLVYGHERVSTTEEIIEICRILRESGGVIKIHLRSEGKEILASVNESVRIGRETGVPIQISHLKALGKKAWPLFVKTLELINRAKDSGVDINFDVSPYHTTGSALYLLTPIWAREKGLKELLEKVNKLGDRKKIVAYLRELTLHYDRILLIAAKTKSVVGKTLAEVAAHTGLSPEETLLDLISANEGRVTMVGRTVSRQNMEAAVKDDNSFVASDGTGLNDQGFQTGDLVHPRCFGAFPHFWHLFVNDLNVLTPEKAIQKITSGPAEKLGIAGRGLIKKGYFADVIIFDPKLLRDQATYKNPFQYATGIEWAIINGRVSIEKGKIISAKAGKVLKRA